MQRARIVHEQFAAKVDRVASSSDCQLVERRLACELGVRIADGTPDHNRHSGVNVGGFNLKILERVWVVDDTRYGHEIDAVFEQDVTHEWQIGRGWFGGDLLVVCGEPSVRVGASAHA